VEALGIDRARGTEEGTQKLLDRADAAPQHSDSLTHLVIPLSSRDPAAQGRELEQLLKPDPSREWSYVTFVNADGTRSARASPWFRQNAALGSAEWLITFTLSDLYMRLGAWWLTQLWRGTELATGARDALGQWTVLVAAACARSLLEGAAHLAEEVPQLIEMWDDFKRSGSPTVESLNGFVQKLNQRLTTLQYASRVGQGQGRPPKIQSTNAITYIQKLAKRRTDFEVVDTYEWLCDAVHPSFGSGTTYCAVHLRDNAGSHILEHYARYPLRPLLSRREKLEPIVAQKAADAVILATDVLDQELGHARWVLDDVGLTTEVAETLLLDFPLAHHPLPERNSRCPCGSGRKSKRCVHRWGQPGTVPDLSPD
jgi:hypothetical protein